MAFTYKLLRRKWKVRKVLYLLMLPELACTVALLVLFGIEQPDLYRTLFWQIGYDNGLNSDPNMILYAYANHVPLPTIPFVWSQTITNFNVAISVLSLFLILVKLIGYIVKVYYPIIGTFVSLGMTVLYAVSVYGQAGPDYADPQYPSPVAWYIRLSCDIATPYGAYSDCLMAKGTFGVTVLFMCIYLTNLGLGLWAMWPDKSLDMKDEDDEEELAGSAKQWEMQPQTPRTIPFTPRTQAFNTLDRKLPFRSN